MNSTALVVSDDIILRAQARRVLSEASIACTCSPTAAIRRVMGSTKFDAILLDMNGEAEISLAIREVREEKLNRYSILFVVVDDGQSASKAWGSGANFTIRRSKSFPDELQRAFQSAHGLMLREKRRYQRYVVSISVEFLHSGRLTRATMVDISERGACLEYPSSLPMYPMQLVFSLPGITTPMRIEGLPAWSRGGKVGIRFTSFSTGCQTLLSEWLASRTGA